MPIDMRLIFLGMEATDRQLPEMVPAGQTRQRNQQVMHIICKLSHTN